jgi:hypothetical protein
MPAKNSMGNISAALRRVAAAPAEAFRKLTKSELQKLGYSEKSERYIEAGKRVSNNTTTISKRAFTVKRFGAGPEKLAEARNEGRIPYKSKRTQEAAEKQKRTRGQKREEKLRTQTQRPLTGREIERSSAGFEHKLSNVTSINAGPNATRPGSYRVPTGSKPRIVDDYRRKLAGEFIPDGRYQMMLDAARAAGAPHFGLLLQSKTEIADDEADFEEREAA